MQNYLLLQTQEIGALIGCFQVHTTTTYCVVRHMDPVVTPDGVPLLNEYDCPLMTRTSIVRFIPSVQVVRSVSVVHQCDRGCKTADTSTTTTVERQQVSVRKTIFQHDWNNDLYCLNVYCMHSDT